VQGSLGILRSKAGGQLDESDAVAVVAGAKQRHADEFRQGVDTHLAHNLCTMDLNRLGLSPVRRR